MSVESDLRAALVAESTLVALVGQRVVQNGIPEGAATPYVVFTSTHAPEKNLVGDTMTDKVTFTVECWATRAFDADAVADAVTVALGNVGKSGGLVADYVDPTYYDEDYLSPPGPTGLSPFEVTARASGFDGDLGLDATVLSVEFWT